MTPSLAQLSEIKSQKATLQRSGRKRTREPFRVRLEVESLESRVVPYAISGNLWPHPELVTISFVPDGTIVGTNGANYVYSNLFAKMNARFGSPAVWQAQILRAAQSWAAQTNINFDIVSDNGTTIGQGAYQQGDPGMGDIRISGYQFTPSILAMTASPPAANNYSIAGDVQFNTAINWNINATYDLFTVAAHEMGHALGLNHSTTNTAVMYASYNGVKSALTSDDVAGVRAIYSSGNPRAGEIGANDTVATATDLSASIDPGTLTALVTSVDVTSTADVDYYTFVAPSSSASSLTVTVQSAGLSLLTPSVTLYAGDGSTVLASAADAGHLGGNTLTLNYSGTIANQAFYVKVTGADSTAFSTGAYGLTLNMGTGPAPTVPLPSTQTANGSPLHSGGGQPETRDPRAARILSTRLGLTLQASHLLLEEAGDADSASKALDKTLDAVIGQLNSQAPASPVRPPVFEPLTFTWPSATITNAFTDATRSWGPALSRAGDGMLLQAISSIFTADQQKWADGDTADAIAPEAAEYPPDSPMPAAADAVDAVV
jgi:hypothetical protein